jgi:cell division protein FtsA
MTRNIAVGIDIGTASIKVVVAEHGAKGVAPRIIGIGNAETKGMRHGYITQADEALLSLKKALAHAEKSAGVEIKKAYLAIGGLGLTSHISQGSSMISRADSEITDLDVKKTQDICKHDLPNVITLNKTLIHTIPLAYRIDGKPVIGRPQGMKGLKLEVRMLFVFALEQHLKDLEQLVNDAGVEIEDVMAGPIAASLVALSKAQKIAGVVLANIGAETVSVSVFENNIPLSLEVFPIGSNDITNDIALGLRIPLEEAEKVKVGESDQYAKKKYEESLTKIYLGKGQLLSRSATSKRKAICQHHQETSSSRNCRPR